jgi:outer membrane protein X
MYQSIVKTEAGANVCSAMEQKPFQKRGVSENPITKSRACLILLAAMLFLFSTANLSAQNQSAKPDIITLLNGDDLDAIVQKVSDTDIEYKKWSNKNGPTYTLKKSEVFSIRYANGEKDVFTKKENPVVAAPVQQQQQNVTQPTNVSPQTATAVQSNAQNSRPSNVTSYSYMDIYAFSKGNTAIGINWGFGLAPTAMIIGVKFNYGLTDKIRLSPSFDYYMKPSNGLWGSAYQINADAHYLAVRTSKLTFYPLAGLTFRYREVAPLRYYGYEMEGEAESKFGLNIGLGLGYNLSDHIVLGSEFKYSAGIDYVWAINLMYKF